MFWRLRLTRLPLVGTEQAAACHQAFTKLLLPSTDLLIGASTAIFSVADAVLLRPLPYKDPGRLVYACADLKTRNVSDANWSGPDYMDLRDHASSALEDVAAVYTGRNNLAHDDGTPEEY